MRGNQNSPNFSLRNLSTYLKDIIWISATQTSSLSIKTKIIKIIDSNNYYRIVNCTINVLKNNYFSDKNVREFILKNEFILS